MNKQSFSRKWTQNSCNFNEFMVENFDTAILKQPKAAFSRATKVKINNIIIIFISGTASVDARSKSVHINNFGGQVRRTYRNIEALLEEASATFKDIVSMTVYLKDIHKFYRAFHKVRNEFFKEKGIFKNPPSSTCVEAKLCRPEFLVEINAIAIRKAH